MPLLAVFLLLLSSASANDPELCIQYADDDKCLSCVNSFVNQELNCQVPKKLLKHCMSYNEAEGCEICAFFHKMVDGHCLPISDSESCVLSDNKGECFLCRQGLALDRNDCVAAKSAVKNCDFGMKENDGLVSCARCARGFTLSLAAEHTVCLPALARLENCLNTYDGVHCTSCDIGFFMTPDGCKKTNKYDFEVSRIYGNAK